MRRAVGAAIFVGAIEFLSACGGDGDETVTQLNTTPVENFFSTTEDLGHGDMQTVLGNFVTDATLHCHFHDGMELGIEVDHTSEAEGGEARVIEVTMADNTFLDANGEPLEEVEVGHGEVVEFAFENTGRVPHNAMLTEPTAAGSSAHTGH
jgi:hypothetical protein